MNHKHSKNIVKGVVMLAAISLLAACSKTDNSATEESSQPNDQINTETILISQEQMEASGMKLEGFSEHVFHSTVSANGMFDVPPGNKASVSAYYSGYVSDIDILSGQKVEEGEVLFTLENPEYVTKQKEFLEAKAQLNYLRTDYERQKTLVQDQVTSQKNYTKAETEYKTMTAQYASLKKQLELMRINPDKLSASSIASKISVKAPISGYLSRVNVNKGMYLEPSDIAVTITNPEHLHVELSIFEKDLKNVQPGQSIVFNLLNDPENKYDAIVYLVGKSIDEEKRTVTIHGHLADKNQSSIFTPGMYLEAKIYTTTEKLLALPNEAIVDLDGQYYVLEQKESSDGEFLFERKEVKIGKRDDSYSQVINTSDFADSSTFVVKGAFNLISD